MTNKSSNNINKRKYDISKNRFRYNEYNSLKARQTNDSSSYLWKMYFELKDKLEQDPSNEEVDQQLRDVKYAIAAVDFLEEIACMYYYNEITNLPFVEMKTKSAEVRYNVIYAKKGGRFRRGSNTPPTMYRDL